MHGSIAMSKFLPRAVLLLALGVSGCGSAIGNPPGGSGDLALIEAAMQQVQKSYVVPVKPDQLVSGSLKGMLSKLDPHSDYMTEHEYRELISTTSGQFRGVGIEISIEGRGPRVLAALEG